MLRNGRRFELRLSNCSALLVGVMLCGVLTLLF